MSVSDFGSSRASLDQFRSGADTGRVSFDSGPTGWQDRVERSRYFQSVNVVVVRSVYLYR